MSAVCDGVDVIPQILHEINWRQISNRLVCAVDGGGSSHQRCMVIEGQLLGVERSAFVCIDSHLVMMIGCMTDMALSDFIQLVLHGESPQQQPEAVPKQRQRGLFDDD